MPKRTDQAESNQWQHACPGSLQGERGSVPYQETTIHALEVGLDFLLPDVRQVPCKGETLRKTGQLGDIPWHLHGIGIDWPTGLELRKGGYGFLAPPFQGMDFCSTVPSSMRQEVARKIHLGRIACTGKAGDRCDAPTGFHVAPDSFEKVDSSADWLPWDIVSARALGCP